MLETVEGLMEKERYRLNNLDCTLVAQVPKLAPYLPEMRKQLARVLQATENLINIKATTSEGPGILRKAGRHGSFCRGEPYSEGDLK